MSERDELFSPEEIDQQVEQVSNFQEGDRKDAEAMAYLRSFYQNDAQQEQQALNRIWNRIVSASLFEEAIQESEHEPMIHQSHIPHDTRTMGNLRGAHPRRASLMRQLGLWAAAVLLIALVGSMAMVFYAVRHQNAGPAAPHPPARNSPGHAPLQVTSVSLSVAPSSIAGIPCGTNMTVTYTALFHVAANSVGGTVQFNYTVNNGRGQTPAHITFQPGQTTQSFAFTWSGPLPADHTAPGLGGVQVTSPNQLTSSLVGPTGQCTALAAFHVTSIDMTVSPASIQGLSCGTPLVVTYTSTIHVAANSPGGTVQFSYTVNNGRGQTPAHITFRPGQTTQSFAFTWSGPLPADHTAPGLGGIQITSPNLLTSSLVEPTGRCQ